MRSISQCLPLAVLAVLVNACDQPTAPTSTARAVVLTTPTASISDAANGGRLGFYFLPSLVADPGSFGGTFDGTLQPYAAICALVSQAAGCGDGDNIMVFPFDGAKPTGITVNALNESYGANWNKPTLGVGKYRLSVYVNAPLFDFTRQIGLGYLDLQVVAKKKDPVDAGFVQAVKGSPIPFKFRVEQGTAALILFTKTYATLWVGTGNSLYFAVYDLNGQYMNCPDATFRSSNPGVLSIDSFGNFRGESVGDATLTVTCRGVSNSMPLTVMLPVPD